MSSGSGRPRGLRHPEDSEVVSPRSSVNIPGLSAEPSSGLGLPPAGPCGPVPDRRTQGPPVPARGASPQSRTLGDLSVVMSWACRGRSC